MESSRLLIRRTPDRELLQPVNLGGNYRYMWIVSRGAKEAYALDLSTAWPHTVVATVSLASITPTAICYRAENDSVYVLGSLNMGIISNASNPASSTLTVITGLTINASSPGGAWAYDYRRDKLFNLDGSGGGALKIVDPQTNTHITPNGWAEGFGEGKALQYFGDIEKLGTCGGISSVGGMFGLWNTVLQRMEFGRVGSGITQGANDACYYDGNMYLCCLQAVVKAQLQLTGELKFIAQLPTTQYGRSICIDRTNNKIVVVANADGAGQNIHFKFIDPATFTINSSPTIAEVSDERQANSLVWSPYNNKCYAITANQTFANPARLIQVDAGTETIDNSMNLPSNLGVSGVALTHNNAICFNGIEL